MPHTNCSKISMDDAHSVSEQSIALSSLGYQDNSDINTPATGPGGHPDLASMADILAGLSLSCPKADTSTNLSATRRFSLSELVATVEDGWNGGRFLSRLAIPEDDTQLMCDIDNASTSGCIPAIALCASSPYEIGFGIHTDTEDILDVTNERGLPIEHFYSLELHPEPTSTPSTDPSAAGPCDGLCLIRSPRRAILGMDRLAAASASKISALEPLLTDVTSIVGDRELYVVKVMDDGGVHCRHRLTDLHGIVVSSAGKTVLRLRPVMGSLAPAQPGSHSSSVFEAPGIGCVEKACAPGGSLVPILRVDTCINCTEIPAEELEDLRLSITP